MEYTMIDCLLTIKYAGLLYTQLFYGPSKTVMQTVHRNLIKRNVKNFKAHRAS